MSVLIIQPVHYQGNKLSDVGEKVVRAFYPLFTDFVIEAEIQPSGLEITVDEEEASAARALGFDRTMEFPGGNPVPAIDFLRFLAQNGKSPVLAITSLLTFAMTNGKVYPLFGVGSSKFGCAYVSANIPELKSNEMLGTEAIHEVGHIKGLRHHKGEQRASGGKLCPMTTEHSQRIKRDGLPLERYFSSRGDFLCGECYGNLGLRRKNPDASLRKQFLNRLEQGQR